MELNDDLVVEIISYLPLKFAIQCKVLSKNFNTKISDLKFSQIGFPRQKISSTLFVYHSYGPNSFHKISINPLVPTTHSETTFLPFYPSVSTSCKGLLLLEFRELTTFCVFNPITGEHQLIPYYIGVDFVTIGDGLAVGYPTSSQYKLVTFNKLLAVQEGYTFHVFSSEGSGEWHEVRFRMTCNYLAFDSKPVYVNDSLHWFRSDGRVVAFNTKREEATILDLPEFINHFDMRLGTWLGISQGLLTLFCIFKESIVIAAYDNISSNWRVTHTLDNSIIAGVDGYINGFPIWIDRKQVLFLQDSRRLMRHQYLYEYDSEINGYKRAEVLNKDYMIKDYLCSFEPTLARVHTTFLDTVHDGHRPAIIATLDELRRFLTEGIR